MTGQEQLDLQQDLFNIYSGILFNFPAFAPGEPADLTYDFHCPEYKTLLEKYTPPCTTTTFPATPSTFWSTPTNSRTTVSTA